ncbi:hypothetical protein CA11_18190 [Gimesia maris]|uniref:three component ABC system middle component n=1 Tax=Gimesia maris TaxID=122 RepID=UPI001189097F|nr:three component ABC system middle component [Gimesia maris]QDU14015.1 hypothetical protein CA11_18190 [Gimesia maris]
MDIQFEREVSQNLVLASWALWGATSRYDEEVNSERGVPFPQMFLVLPLVFHKKSASIIQAKQMTEGSFYRALTDNRTLIVGLQQRVQNYSDITMKALNLSFASKLLLLDKDSLEIAPGRKSLPAGTQENDVKIIIKASKRIGYWLAITDFSVVCKLLRIRF